MGDVVPFSVIFKKPASVPSVDVLVNSGQKQANDSSDKDLISKVTGIIENERYSLEIAGTDLTLLETIYEAQEEYNNKQKGDKHLRPFKYISLGDLRDITHVESPKDSFQTALNIRIPTVNIMDPSLMEDIVKEYRAVVKPPVNIHYFKERGVGYVQVNIVIDSLDAYIPSLFKLVTAANTVYTSMSTSFLTKVREKS